MRRLIRGYRICSHRAGLVENKNDVARRGRDLRLDVAVHIRLDPDNGVAPGTPWEEVPEDWTCPLCSVGKDQFSPEE